MRLPAGAHADTCVEAYCADERPGPVTSFLVDVRDLRVAGGLMLAAAVAMTRFDGFPTLSCPLRSLTGIPCPLCGMTTSVVRTVQGRWSDAVAATPAGLVAVAVAVALLALPRLREIRVYLPAVVAALAGMWVFQLFRFQVL